MEMKWLEDFLSISETGSFSQSAKDRNVTQPAFSRRIKSLENWVGVKLIDRRTYPVSLTPHGAEFIKTAEQVLSILYRAQQSFKIQKNGQHVLSFATLDALSTNFFSEWYSIYQDKKTDPTPYLRVFDLYECIEMLREGTCDFMLCYGHDLIPLPLNRVDFEVHKLATDYLIPVSQADAFGRPKFEWHEKTQAQIPFLAYADKSFLGQFVKASLSRENAAHRFSTIYENNTSISLKNMAIQGYGLAWIPERLIKEELANGDLVIAADEKWAKKIDICLYKSSTNTRHDVTTFWEKIVRNDGGGLAHNELHESVKSIGFNSQLISQQNSLTQY